ncbi:CBS domain-containing protein [Streptoalloteichus tenebrarius]|uniref:CBS domain-containing protein n=1 Tax=Streptoalloteichus tenebrarius (strain ATCC 17920 / DSM 40477 / JCM 4838 / CBS 697.72 / NBRC 16177 / NCIMB 11028 / NRRL B-12390 / A12253. 1 / ISP 5477) TaxID=1933 RepID=A0ABT1HUA9_STRSD|nr:CBS domain-containing protein [Streptoalloteichus tenebrarius]MCP2259110.1 CBS domain-containing protein [Streptoalloteichus tenebrarius]BFE99564.1 CBS domain-containing protein [Streptoalloteichus tenebrarius]
MRRPTVADAMTRDVISVSPGTPLTEVADLLAVHQIGAVPVVTAKGVLAGVVPAARVAERVAAGVDAPDVLEAAAGPVPAPRRRTWWRTPSRPVVEDVMAPPAATIRAGAPLPEATRRLAASGVDRLWVVDDANRLVGVLTRRDLLRRNLRSDEEIRAEVADQVLGRVLGARPGSVTVTVRDGVVTLTGRLQWRSDVDLAVWLTLALPGVVDVVNQLGCLYLDPPAARQEMRLLRERSR